MNEIVANAVGLVFTLALGFGIGPFLDSVVSKPKQPKPIDDEKWEAITQRSGSGKWIGRLEGLLSFIAFSTAEYTLLGGWLAFKLAAKWEAWKNIVQVPTELEGIPPLTWFQVRKGLGSWLLSRFLIGTLASILVGAAGAYLSRSYCKYIGLFCTKCP